MRSWIIAGLFISGVALTGCAPAIGDGCQNSANCSVTGDRVCDTTYPGGSCTIFGCEEGTCPPEAVCVRWRPMASRLEFNACMRRCEDDGSCRVDEGYHCLAAADIEDPSTGADLAEVIDADASSFCVATEPLP